MRKEEEDSDVTMLRLVPVLLLAALCAANDPYVDPPCDPYSGGDPYAGGGDPSYAGEPPYVSNLKL